MGSPDKIKKPREADSEQQYGPADPEPVNPQGAQSPSFAGDRRLTHSGTIILNEAVVGSAHDNAFPLPFNLDRSGRAARVQMSVADPQFRLSLPEVELASLNGGMSGEKSPKATVMFKPTHPGGSIAIVQFNATWEDGHSEQLEVQVVASARRLDDVPGSGAGDATLPNSVPKPAESEPPPSLAIFEERAAQLKGHVEAIAASQERGIEVIEKEASRYIAPPPPKPAWMLLAELALTVGTAGVASIIGKYVADKVVGLMAKEATHLEAAAAKEAGHIATSASNKIESTAAHASDDVARVAVHGSHAAVPATPSVAHQSPGSPHGTDAGHANGGAHLASEGLSAGVEDLLKEAKPKIPEPRDPAEASNNDEKVSEDMQIQFFDAQKEGLATTMTGRSDAMIHMVTGLRAAAQTDPAGAVGAMNAIIAAFDAGKAQAKTEQMTASATKWVSYAAQGKHGSAVASAHGKQQSVTKTDDLRGAQPVMAGEEIAAQNSGGVLEVIVYVDDDLRSSVRGARLDGVSRLIGDRLLTLPLATAGVPVRIRTGWKDVITVDEVGRVRTSGPRQYEPDPSGESAGAESQNNDAAQKIVNSVFSKTLSQWGISHVGSDDAHARPAAAAEDKAK